MSFQILEQDMANAIGFVMDRTVNPPRFLAQGFLVSKSRFVTTAGQIFHYTECPWALSIYFPHPDITLAVKSIGLHNEFEKPLIRQAYLAQTGYPGELLPTLPNDMALLVVDTVMPDMVPEKVAELHRAMSLPFSNKGVEASGNCRGQEYIEVLNSLLEQGKSGLLTLIDAYNITDCSDVDFAPKQYRPPRLLSAGRSCLRPMLSLNWHCVNLGSWLFFPAGRRFSLAGKSAHWCPC